MSLTGVAIWTGTLLAWRGVRYVTTDRPGRERLLTAAARLGGREVFERDHRSITATVEGTPLRLDVCHIGRKTHTRLRIADTGPRVAVQSLRFETTHATFLPHTHTGVPAFDAAYGCEDLARTRAWLEPLRREIVHELGNVRVEVDDGHFTLLVPGVLDADAMVRLTHVGATLHGGRARLVARFGAAAATIGAQLVEELVAILVVPAGRVRVAVDATFTRLELRFDPVQGDVQQRTTYLDTDAASWRRSIAVLVARAPALAPYR